MTTSDSEGMALDILRALEMCVEVLLITAKISKGTSDSVRKLFNDLRNHLTADLAHRPDMIEGLPEGKTITIGHCGKERWIAKYCNGFWTEEFKTPAEAIAAALRVMEGGK